METPKIRKANSSDVKDIIRLLVELAVYEKEPNAVKVTEEELINLANGSPGKILNNIKMWNELPNEIKHNLDFPLSDKLEILKISKIISEELEINQQVFLVNFIQKRYWAKTKNKNIINK